MLRELAASRDWRRVALHHLHFVGVATAQLMGADLPGGGRKPRTATPLAWRLLYLGARTLR